MSQRILMIVTSNHRMGAYDKPTGLWAEELATPWYALADAGVAIELASPAGGPAPIDPGSIQPEGRNEAAVARFLADPDLRARVAATSKTADLDMAGFDAVFFPGGHGTMWDLPGDAGVKRLVEQAEAAGKIISSVCHGAAGLVSARRADGRPLVADRTVNAFTNAEEIEVGLQEVVPFLLESRLRELGGRFECAPNWHPFAVRDGNLITGQNPQSSERVAREVLQALGLAA